MSHSSALQSLLFDIRQHPAFQEFLAAVAPPRMPPYRKGDTLEAMGAATVFASGEAKQHERWMVVLTGQVPARETETSQPQEKA